MILKLQTDLHNGSSRIMTSLHSTKRLVPWFPKSLWLSNGRLDLLPPHLSKRGSAFSVDDVASSKSWPLADAAIIYYHQHLRSLLWTRTHHKSATAVNNDLLHLKIFPHTPQQDFIHLYKTIVFTKSVCKTKLILYRHSDLNTQMVHSDRGCLLVSFRSSILHVNLHPVDEGHLFRY